MYVYLLVRSYDQNEYTEPRYYTSASPYHIVYGVYSTYRKARDAESTLIKEGLAPTESVYINKYGLDDHTKDRSILLPADELDCDILTVDADVICQQVNCRGVMGAGLAKQIAGKWPEVKRQYIDLCGNRAQYELLGNIQVIDVDGGKKSICNVFGQFSYGRDRMYTDYKALKNAMNKINNTFRGKTVAFPHMFGCGLAGGDWDVVQEIIEDGLPHCKVIICKKPIAD